MRDPVGRRSVLGTDRDRHAAGHAIALPGFDLRLIDFELIAADVKISRPAEITGEARSGTGCWPSLRMCQGGGTEQSRKDQRERGRARQASTHPSLRAQAWPAGLVTNLPRGRHLRARLRIAEMSRRDFARNQTLRLRGMRGSPAHDELI